MTETGLTTASVAGNSARLADKTAANAMSKALSATDATSSIAASAGKAAAESYAAMAGIPYVGPVLGAAAAAAAFTAVMSYDVLSAAGGLALGPGENPIVQLHENETVLPAHIAQPLTAMATGNTDNSRGGDTYNGGINFNVTANGGRNVSSGDDVLSALNAAVRGGRLQGYPALARMMRRGG